MRFEAKKDKLLVGPLLVLMSGGVVLVLMSLNQTLDQGSSAEQAIILGTAGVFVVSFLIILDALRRTYYELKEDHLYIRFGIFQSRVFYQDITEFKESKLLFSSLAWTFDRVAIYKKGRLNVLVGPVEKAAFLHALEKKITPPTIDF